MVKTDVSKRFLLIAMVVVITLSVAACRGNKDNKENSTADESALSDEIKQAYTDILSKGKDDEPALTDKIAQAYIDVLLSNKRNINAYGGNEAYFSENNPEIIAIENVCSDKIPELMFVAYPEPNFDGPQNAKLYIYSYFDRKVNLIFEDDIVRGDVGSMFSLFLDSEGNLYRYYAESGQDLFTWAESVSKLDLTNNKIEKTDLITYSASPKKDYSGPDEKFEEKTSAITKEQYIKKRDSLIDSAKTSLLSSILGSASPEWAIPPKRVEDKTDVTRVAMDYDEAITFLQYGASYMPTKIEVDAVKKIDLNGGKKEEVQLAYSTRDEYYEDGSLRGSTKIYTLKINGKNMESYETDPAYGSPWSLYYIDLNKKDKYKEIIVEGFPAGGIETGNWYYIFRYENDKIVPIKATYNLNNNLGRTYKESPFIQGTKLRAYGDGTFELKYWYQPSSGSKSRFGQKWVTLAIDDEMRVTQTVKK